MFTHGIHDECESVCIVEWGRKWKSYEAVVALRQDDGLLQTVHHDPPQLLQNPLENRLLTHRRKQHQTEHTHTHTIVKMNRRESGSFLSFLLNIKKNLKLWKNGRIKNSAALSFLPLSYFFHVFVEMALLLDQRDTTTGFPFYFLQNCHCNVILHFRHKKKNSKFLLSHTHTHARQIQQITIL